MKRVPILLVALFHCFIIKANAISIGRSFELVRKNRMEAKSFDFERKKMKSQKAKIKSNEDLLISNRTNFGKDSLKSTTFLRDYAEIYSNELSLASQNRWGSKYSLSLTTTRSFIKNPIFLYQFSPAISSSPDQVFVNPNFNSQLSFSWEQPLWRNLGGRETRLQEDVVESRLSYPTTQKNLLLMSYYHKSEGLFYQLSYLKKLRSNTSSLKEEIRSLRNLTRKRMKIGRADSLALADTNTQFVEAGGFLLDIKLNENQVRSSLGHFLFPLESIEGKNYDLPNLLTRVQNVPTDFAQAKKLAWSRRQDLKEISRSIAAYRKELSLIQERDKATVNLFLGIQSNSINDNLSNSLEKSFQLENNQYSIGLTFQKNMTSTANHSDKREALLSIATLENDVKIKEQEIHEKLSLLYQELSFFTQRLVQANKEISSLENLIRAENNKFKQARSDRITKIKYNIKILEIKAKKWEYHYAKRLSELNIKLLCHNYN